MSDKIIIIVFVFAFLMINACQLTPLKNKYGQSFLLPEQLTAKDLQFPETLSQQQMKEDIEYLDQVISKAYSGYFHLNKKYFINFKNKLYEAINTNSSLDFHHKIDEALFEIPDNHLKAFYKGKVSQVRGNYLNLHKGSVGQNNYSGVNGVWQIRQEKIKNKKILYISILNFPYHENNIWDGFLNSIEKHLNKVNVVVIDLRGNTGGDDYMGLQLAGMLYGRSFLHPIIRQFELVSKDAVALAMNNLKIDIYNLKLQNKEIPTYLNDEFLLAQKRYNTIKNFSTVEIETKELLKPVKQFENSKLYKGFKKPIYVLVDSACGSSCEFTVIALKVNKKVITVGENTQGTIHNSNAGVAVLPNSKFKIIVPSQYNELSDNQFLERIGITPDIKVNAGEDAYEYLKESELVFL